MPLLQEPNKSGARASGTGEDEAAGLQREVKLTCAHYDPLVLPSIPLTSQSFSARNGGSLTTDLPSELSSGARGSLQRLNASRT